MSNNIKRKTGLRKKIILSIFFIAIIPGLAGLLITYYQGKRGLRESIGSSFQEIARETAKKVDIVLENEVDEAKHLSISYEIKDVLSRANQRYNGKKHETIKKELMETDNRWNSSSAVDPFDLKIIENSASSFLKRFNYLEPEGHIELAVYDKEGGLVASIKKTERYYIGNESWWNVVSGSNRIKAYLSDVSYHDKTETYAFDIVYPIVDEKAGGFMGIIRMVHDAGMFFNEVTNIRIGKTGHANLISSAGTIIVCPIYPIKSHNITESLIVEIFKKRLGWTIAEDDAHGGKNSVVGFAPVNFVEKNSSDGINFGGKKWYIFVRQDPSETYAPINRLMWQVSIIALSLAIVLGALGFYAANRIMKPIHTLHTGAEIIGNGDLTHRVSVNTGDEIEQLAKEFNHMAEKLKIRQEDLENAYLGTIKAITSAIDAKDKYTRGHSKRVTDISLAMGKQLGFNSEKLSILERASLFHDVGKIGIEDAILNKVSKLTEAEYSIIKKHPQIGVDIIKDVDYLKPIIPIIRHDHERYNGSGYPDGLEGESIPLEARIISVADFYDAITTNRPYRKGLGHEEAVREIITLSGSYFDPKIIDIFLECIEDFRKSANGDDSL